MIKIFLGRVTSVGDDFGGNRIQVKIPSDDSTPPTSGYPYAYPLLPKTIQTMPKQGEMVLVFLANPIRRHKSPRFYIGPIVSQFQKMYKDEFGERDDPACLITGSTGLYETLDHFSETYGSFPSINDVALIGRKSEDVILKDDEINIRCGIRNPSNNGEGNRSLVGDIIYNSSDPAYIQLKHLRGSSLKNKNLINLVGSGINLMSNSDAQLITTYMKNNNNVNINIEDKKSKTAIAKRDELDEQKVSYKEPDYDNIINQLHQIPYGDVLVQVLEIIRDAINTHVHPWALLPPVTEGNPQMEALQTWGDGNDATKAPTLSSILLSDTVRIS